MTELKKIRAALAHHQPKTLTPGPDGRAAVAMILSESKKVITVLLLRRAEKKGDPWSGHLAFPGGRIEATDASPRAAAERETEEETGLNLSSAQYLGQLDDVQGGNLPILVSAFVYHLPSPLPLTLSAEISEGAWISFSQLTDPGRRTLIELERGDQKIRLPALKIDEGRGPLLWGLTYRLIESFLALTGGRP